MLLNEAKRPLDAWGRHRLQHWADRGGVLLLGDCSIRPGSRSMCLSYIPQVEGPRNPFWGVMTCGALVGLAWVASKGSPYPHPLFPLLSILMGEEGRKGGLLD